MKKNLHYVFFFLLTFYSSNKTIAQSANRSLSNLTSPTKINTDLLPDSNNRYDLGSAGRLWKNVYARSAYFLMGSKFISAPGTENNFIGSDAGHSNNSGNTNFAGGYHALYSNTSGSINTATGAYSLNANTKGNYNTATGAYCMNSNTTGEHNTANGRAALYHNGAGNYNTAMGDEALYENNGGSNNTAVGNTALGDNTLGNHNTAVGNLALLNNTTGHSNTGIGTYALYKNFTGNNLVAIGDSALYNQNGGSGANTAIGSKAMYYNVSGSNNTSTGWGSLYSNSSGNYNTATGVNALHFNLAANYNTAHGYYALYSNTNGTDNTASGAQALFYNNNGNNNTADGVNALLYNTTGNYNTAQGEGALYSNTTGWGNTVDGEEGMYYNTYGSYNTAIGVGALWNNTGAYYNCAVGYLALAYADNPGYNNVAVGSFSGPSVNTSGLYNTISIGTSAITTASNQARIGNNSTTSIGGYTDWSNISDGRVKKNIKQNVPGLAFINKLTPITYNLDLDAADKIIQKLPVKDKGGKVIQPSAEEINARNLKQQIIYTGFIAQDVEKVAKSLNYNFSGVDAAKNDKDLYGLRYAEFVVPLVKAVQELSAKNDSLQKQNYAQQKINADLESRIAKLEAMKNVSNQSTANSQLSVLSSASLAQNIPNPFSNTTTISYSLPQQFSSAKIIITDKNGNALKQINLSNKSKGSVLVDASTLASGAYQYSLIVDGRVISAKQMVLAK